MAVGKRVEHRLEGRDAGFAHEAAAVVSRATNGADAEPRRRDRVDLAVAMPRHQHIDPVLPFPRDRGEQMLTVPKRQDDRHVGFTALVNIFRLEREARRHSDEPQIFGGGDSDRRFSPSLSRDVLP
jgi:hypothetical protein